MPRAKDRPILFEVIDRGKPMRTPTSKPGPAESAETASRFRPTPPPEKPRRLLSALGGIVAPRRDDRASDSKTKKLIGDSSADSGDSATTSERGAPGPMVHFRLAGRDLSLSWMSLVGAAAAVVIVTIALYQIGVRLSGGRAADPTSNDDALNAALTGAPDPSVLDLPASARRAGPRIAGAQPASDSMQASDDRAATNGPQSAPTRSAEGGERLPVVERQKGLYYVVVQHFQRSRDADARAAGDFLSANGIPCGVVDSGKDLRLIAAESFNIEQKDESARKIEQTRCNDLLRRIQGLGKQYSRTGRYTFRDCYADKY